MRSSIRAATLSFTAFSVGYVEMARRVTTAGGFYSYTSYGFGRIVGLATAIGIAAAYMFFALGVNGVTSYFAFAHSSMGQYVPS